MLQTTGNRNSISTSDSLIRIALKNSLESRYKNDTNTIIIEEVGILHGSARIDIAVINGIIHGYEIKSDLDTLYRLPEQIKYYSSVFDKITLVVGKAHLYNAIQHIPDWWGVMIAKSVSGEGIINFVKIRESDENPTRDSVSIAMLLWKREALEILEKMDHAKGVRSKSRNVIYERLASIVDQDVLRAEVRRYLLARTNWRFGRQHTPNDD